jgi:hypothetical protein
MACFYEDNPDLSVYMQVIKATAAALQSGFNSPPAMTFLIYVPN